jgi:hypothetical protein
MVVYGHLNPLLTDASRLHRAVALDTPCRKY